MNKRSTKKAIGRGRKRKREKEKEDRRVRKGDERETGSGRKWLERKKKMAIWDKKASLPSLPLWGGGTQLGSPQ